MRTWWLALAGVVAAVTIVIVLASPVVVEPLFQRTEPLRDPSLRADVLELAHRAGVDAGEVLVNDAGSRTAGANAYVSGFGATRRIVLYDTLVNGFPRRQVRVVVAHELAHVRAGHVLKGTSWIVVLAAPVCLLLFALVVWRTGGRSPTRDAAGCDLVVRRLAVLLAAPRSSRRCRRRCRRGSAARSSGRPSWVRSS